MDEQFNSLVRDNADGMLGRKRTVTVPLTGEVNSPWLGSMTRPCPMTPDAKQDPSLDSILSLGQLIGLIISTEVSSTGSWLTNSASS